jgi:sensor domain DACNV-containing protein
MKKKQRTHLTRGENARAIARWEGEGGARKSASDEERDLRDARDAEGRRTRKVRSSVAVRHAESFPRPTARDPTAQNAAISKRGSHAYPSDLAQAVHRRCPGALIGTGVHLTLPSPAQLDEVLSVCYQASLLREEGRPVTFRVAFAGQEVFPLAAGPPAGLHRLVFGDSRPFDQHELRRLAPAAVFSRTLIGASIDRDGDPRIWGMIHSGAHWLQSVRGGRETQQAIPPVLIIAVSGPGRVLVSAGTVTIAELTNGTLISRGMDVFHASWLEDFFAGGIELAAPIEKGRPRAPSVTIAPGFATVLACHVLRRVLATVRGFQHGGMLIIVPERGSNELLTDGRYIRLKYAFADEESRRRVRTLTAKILNEVAAAHPGQSEGQGAGWNEYETSDARGVIEGDAALFEAAHLVADLTHVDGAVVMTTGLDLLGFGGEIAGDLPEVPRVMCARDLAGVDREWVRTDRVGTRHRSAYRLCHTLRDALAVVVSQDGGLRFIRWHKDAVTYWEQVATTPWEV